MVIGKRLRELRDQKGFSQGDLERKTGLLRCYISRVEHGNTVPSLETLQRFADGLEVPLYQLFYVAEAGAPTPRLSGRKTLEELVEDSGQPEGRFLLKLRRLTARMKERERGLLVLMAQKLAGDS